MNLKYTYKKEEDIWCLLNKGKSSNNSPNPTKVYQELVQFAGENPGDVSTSQFIDKYIKENNIVVSEFIKIFQRDFNKISKEFQKIAEKVFGVSLNKDVTVYLTINTRCPYNLERNLFFVSVSSNLKI
jgi:hypothetical protein